ncbi:MAG: purine-nucleoside phosphorylase [Synergistaceae bacterium]|nr:purine-nucleoside phosphorylase [Synergistaceae bacterium]MBQ9628662.1 purine-nucleoside phosphorylase [Synergistaceae bacterium]MBR0070508.1 purine-nucleoside phosphorylase [Synergistaceae bacterium]
MPEYNYSDAQEALNYIKQFIKSDIQTAIITGSGLGDIANIITDKIIIDTKKIPNWPSHTAPGHEGKLIAGIIEGRNAIIFQGRVHYYEGHSMKAVIFPVRVAGMLGVREMIITNASGAINTNYKPGEIIAVRDHINLMGDNPLTGKNESRWNERFPDMTNAYDKEMLNMLSSMGLKQGVYIAFTGPSFETPAEVRMAGILGADLAGMSTVPEVIAANSMGMRVAVLSCAANMAAGILPDKKLTGQEVLVVMKESSHELSEIIKRLIKQLNHEKE